MTTRTKSAIFLGLIFALSWPLLIGSWLSGNRDPADSGLVMLAFAASPGLSAILCTLAFERGHCRKALGLRFRPNAWWLWAMLIPLALAFASIGLTAALGPHRIADMDAMIAKAAKTLQFPAEQGLPGLTGALGLILLRNVVLFSLMEELAWRGYLHALWRPFGFWRTALGTGLVWGVWHWPMIYFYGLNYPNASIIGLAVFPISTMLTACLMTMVRDRGGSVWAAGIMHGAINTFGLLFLFSLGDLGWPWGVVGIGGILATAIAVAAVWKWQRGESASNPRRQSPAGSSPANPASVAGSAPCEARASG